MLTALHAMIYSDDPAATRRFLMDVLRWPFVSEGARGDAGVGGAGTGGTDPAEWLIFRSGPSELGVHPTREGNALIAEIVAAEIRASLGPCR